LNVQQFFEAIWLPLVFAVAGVVLVYVAVYAGSARKAKRYRPGRPFDFRPVWFLSAESSAATTAAIGAARGHAELTSTAELTGTAAGEPHGQTGGASDRW
jgi:hypothetical protein